MMTVNSTNACKPPTMPQEQRRKSCDEYDVISSDFPPPSLKPVNSPEQDKRKKKKWSIGGLFRRKKKVSDTDSSSPLEDEEEKKGFLERRRARKRRNRGSKDVSGSFEHVIINHRQSQVLDNTTELKDVSNDRVGRSHESLAKREPNHISRSSVSLEGAGKKGGRLHIKARVEESRDRLRGDSSSDEGGGSSKHSSSSFQRVKGDETVSKDGSLSRRSRAARTERYKKRLSKDEESLRDFNVPCRISRSDERLSNKKGEKPGTTNRWTAKVVYYESSDYDTKYTAITKSATPSPIQSPKARPKNALHYTSSAPPTSNYVTYPPSHASPREGVVGSHQELRSQHYPLERVPPTHRYPDLTPPRLPKSNSEMITKPAQLPNSIQRHYSSWGQEVLNRKSASYDCNVNSLHYVNNQISQPHPKDENILVVQFPLSRPAHKVENKVKMGLQSLQYSGKQQNPPPPPPRDPHRRLVSGNGYHNESCPRPMSYAFEDRSPMQPKYPGYPEFGSSSSAFQRVPQNQIVPIDFEPVISMNKHQRSSSDNHIPRMGVKQSPPMARRMIQPEHAQSNYQGSLESYASSPPSDNLQSAVPCHYQYYTDQQPRSRKPIHIAYQNHKPQNDPYLSDSQVVVKPPLQQTPRARPPGVQNAADFWKQKDQENAKKVHLSEGSPKLIQRHLLNIPQGNERSRSNSPLKNGNVSLVKPKIKLPPLIMPVKGIDPSSSLNSPSLRDNYSPRTPTTKNIVHNEIGIPVFDSMDLNSNSKRPLSMLEEKQETSEQEVSPTREKINNPPTPPKRRDSKVNAVTNFEHFDVSSDNEKKEGRRKSSNLEEALNELEAIYKSLRLGEDSYLEKVEKEKAVYENNRLDPSNWNAWVQSRGFESDSSFNYSRSSLESVDSVDSPIRSSNFRRTGEPDRVTDDMAYRRLNKKDRPSAQEQEVLSQAGSFLLVSPTLSPPPFMEPPPVPQISKEPDVEKDDVVYRSIKHVNNTLKCLDPQPPFGIPLGPITPAPNSDYLHVSPKETFRPSFKPRKMPDVVTDDLAFRNLRKDNNKEPLFSAEENTVLDSPTLKKKRAVRSLSANLLSIIQRESVAMKNNNNKLIYNNNNVPGELEKSQSFTDVNDALNVNGRSTNGHIEKHQKARDISYKKNLSGEDSDVTPRVSRAFSTGTSSPLTATSTETLTGSKNSLCTPESKTGSSKLSKSPSPRLSRTPERRHTIDNVNFHPHKSISPSKYNPIKNDSSKIPFSASYPKSDFHRSPTPDSHTFIHQNNRIRVATPPAYGQNESDLLAILAREAKEASEQLSKELNELNFENDLQPTKNNFKNAPEIKKEQIEKKDAPISLDNNTKLHTSKPLAIGKIIPHKPVKLNTFFITEDEKLESKQTVITNKPIDIEGSKSMTDLLKELTRSLDLDFGNPPKDPINQISINEDKTNSKEEKRQNTIETKCEEITSNEIEHDTTDFRECEDKYFSSQEDVSDERFSSPEKFLQSFVAEATAKQKEQVEQKSKQLLTELLPEMSNDQTENHMVVDEVIISPEGNVVQNLESGISVSNASLGESDKSHEGKIPLAAKTAHEEEYFVKNVNNDLLSNPQNQDSAEVDEVLNLLNEESLKQSEEISPASSPLPKKFPLELPPDELVEEKSPKSEVPSHSCNEADTSTLQGHAGAPDESSPPGTSRESRLVPRDCIDCPRMTDEDSGVEICPPSAMVVLLDTAESSERERMEGDAARQQRISRYKEQRRRQLAAQYGTHDVAPSPASSGGITIRSTRASRLRSAAAATTTANGTSSDSPGNKGVEPVRRQSTSERKEVNGRLGPCPLDSKEKSPLLSDNSSSSGPRRERDKSAKRKSNLNRSLNAEPVQEDAGRRRRSMVLSSPAPRSPPITAIPTAPASAPETDSPRHIPVRAYKRTTPPRDSPRHRPRSSSTLLDPAVPAPPAPCEASPQVNGQAVSPPEVSDPPQSLPDVVVLSSAPAKPSSILKKKSVDETSSPTAMGMGGKPVSILKRKTSQEEGISTTSQPVTFSPSVVEPSTSRRQGILKKHRSLDDGGGMMVRRSASPDKPILKHQRRSSLEEVRRRTQSPEPTSILKRKTSRDEAVDSSLACEPQGILKRKTSSSSGPVHVTIADSVILAVAGEDSLSEDHVRPILKKKTSVSEEPSQSQDSLTLASSEAPKPILKKKSSSETEESEDKPMKPILKSRSSSRVSEGRSSFTDLETPMNGITPGVEVEPSALSVRSESSPERSVIRRIVRNDPDTAAKRRSLDSWVRFREDCERGNVQSPRVRSSWSVAERVLNMESFLANEASQRPRSLSPGTENKGAVPKRTRDGDRWRTQPITVQELSDSRSWSLEQAEMLCSGREMDNGPNTGVSEREGAEKEEDEEEEGRRLARSNSVSARASMFEAMRQQREETQIKKVSKGSSARRVKLDPSRFQTQPVTQDEVEEAKRANEASKSSSAEDDDPNDPSKLSLAERVKLFNEKMVASRFNARTQRHKTQPITPEEVETAQKLTPMGRSASSVLVSGILKNLSEKNLGPKQRPSSESEEDSVMEPSSPQKRGILKSPSRNPKPETVEDSDPSYLKSVLKKENKISEPDRKSKDLHSILKVSKDKASSSSEETESDSEEDKPNANSDLIDLLHKVEAQARGERKANASPERRKSLILNNNKKPEESDKLMNLKNLDQGKENYDVTRRFRRKKESGDLSGEDSSSSGGREVRKIIGNDAIARRRQAGLAREAAERAKRTSGGDGLSKSRSHSAMNGEVVLRPPSGPMEAAPLRRCRTQPMDECDEPLTNGVSIAQRLEALQKRGQTDWKKRVSRLNPGEELPPSISINAAAQVLVERVSTPSPPAVPPPVASSVTHTLSLLQESSEGWKRRVSPSDATKFSVAGKMGGQAVPASPLLSPNTERKKVKPERFRSKGPAPKDVQSVPTSPDADISAPSTPAVFKRSVSAPGEEDSSLSSGENEGPLVTVPKAFDEDFSNFFATSSVLTGERIELRDEDLETVTSSTSQLLVQRRQVRVQRRRVASSNPVKALAARTDLRDTYVEVKSGVASREEQRLRIEKLAKNSSLAVEALAGLASKEDFAGVQLRSTAQTPASVHTGPWLPYADLMLLQVKGRRHVQTRLVRPHYTSVNQGDSYVLITTTQVFQWLGEYSNVIERSRSAEIATHIAQTRDLGCSAANVIVVQGRQPNKQFWQLLGADEETAASYKGAEAGHPDEDELYELAVTDTNKIYELEGDELVPREDCWANIPRIEILSHNKVLVFDFGAELYVWMGKSVSLDRRPTVLKLAQELWNHGFDYSECDICPITQAELLGTRKGQENKEIEKCADKRPNWCLLAKVTQHMETVLFREKFLDWPDFSRVIQVKNRDKGKQVESQVEMKPCDAQEMVDWSPAEPDLQLEGSHLGRGHKYYDSETHRHFEISTLGVTVWHVQEFDSTELEDASVGQFHSGDSYVVRWHYSVTVTGRELTGQPSRHSTMGRDRVAYWTWQGRDASINDSGAAALLTVQLDKERGPQLTIKQGNEPAAFRRLFNSGLVVHKGRRCDGERRKDRWRLYIVLGEETAEATLLEVPLHCRQLRSRGCLVLLDTEEGKAYLWRGAHALDHTLKVALAAVEKLKEELPFEAGLEDIEDLQVEEICEGKEPKLFFQALGGHNRLLYHSLLSTPAPLVNEAPTTRLFLLTGVSGALTACPAIPACGHTQLPSPFPYTQETLYDTRQPALYLVDAGVCLWLWQGWVSEAQADAEVGVRWQYERRAAMATTLQYHKLRHSAAGATPAPRLVWAGLEPLEFTNLFPTWECRDEVTEINISDGHAGELVPVEAELERLTQSTFPPSQLLQRPLPDGVDPTRLEDYLAPSHFQEVLGLSKEEFSELPAWKQNKLKQEKGLF